MRERPDLSTDLCLPGADLSVQSVPTGPADQAKGMVNLLSPPFWPSLDYFQLLDSQKCKEGKPQDHERVLAFSPGLLLVSKLLKFQSNILFQFKGIFVCVLKWFFLWEYFCWLSSFPLPRQLQLAQMCCCHGNCLVPLSSTAMKQECYLHPQCCMKQISFTTRWEDIRHL